MARSRSVRLTELRAAARHPDGAALADAWARSYERGTDELFAVLDDDELTALAATLLKLGAAPTGDAPDRPAPA